MPKKTSPTTDDVKDATQLNEVDEWPKTGTHAERVSAVQNASIAGEDDAKADFNNDDPQTKSITGSKSGNTNTTDSSELTESSEGDKTLIEKCLSKIPFTILVAMLMAIPIGFLIIYSIINFVDSAGTLQYIGRHKEFLLSLGDCGGKITLERGTTSLVQAGNTSDRWAAMMDSRAQVDAACATTISLAMDSSDKQISRKFVTMFRGSFETLSLVRFQAVANSLSTTDIRKCYTDILLNIDKGRSLVALHPSMKKSFATFMELKLVRLSATNIAGCRGAGAEILSAIEAGEQARDELIIEYGGFWEVYYAFMDQLRTVSRGPGVKYIQLVDNNQVTQQAIMMMNSLYHDSDHSSFTSDEWFAAFTAALDEARGLESEFVDHIADSASSALVIEIAKLLAALIGCTFAAALILKSNVMTQKRIDKAMLKSKTMQKAVQKFVPRAFLKLCGCTSILHVSAGDETQVAVSMLFSDIRNFTSVSEHMTNEQLFAWLQSYFKKMTGITEGNHGFIDQFNGDAIFSVFSSAKGAVQCGIDMHIAVGQLNLEFVGKRDKHLIQIGVGVHYAVVSAGFLGDENRLTVTLISPEVNTPQRLEKLTRKYGARIFVSQQAVSQLGDLSQFDCRRMGEVVFRGSDKPFGIMEVYQADVIEMKNYKNESKSVFEEAVELRANGKIDKSNMLFERCRTMASAVDLEDDAVAVKLSHADRRDLVDDQ